MEAEAPAAPADIASDENHDPAPSAGSQHVAPLPAIEVERRRLARSLNDGPSQVLSNLVLRAESVERFIDSDPGRAREEAARLREAAVAALGQVRRFMFDTYPSVLEDLGLVATLQRYVQARSGPSRPVVDLRVAGQERRLSHATELAVFRAAQDALSRPDLLPATDTATLTISFLTDAIELVVASTGGPIEKVRVPA